MSTQNFAYENILVALNEEWEEWDINFFREDIGEELERRGFCRDDNYMYDGLSRSYGGRYIAYKDINHADGRHYARVYVYMRSGYYSGSNIDYIVEHGEDDFPRGEKALQARVDTCTRMLRKLLPKYGTELRRVAVFSNGEAVYKKRYENYQ